MFLFLRSFFRLEPREFKISLDYLFMEMSEHLWIELGKIKSREITLKLKTCKMKISWKQRGFYSIYTISVNTLNLQSFD